MLIRFTEAACVVAMRKAIRQVVASKACAMEREQLEHFAGAGWMCVVGFRAEMLLAPPWRRWQTDADKCSLCDLCLVPFVESRATLSVPPTRRSC